MFIDTFHAQKVSAVLERPIFLPKSDLMTLLIPDRTVAVVVCRIVFQKPLINFIIFLGLKPMSKIHSLQKNIIIHINNDLFHFNAFIQRFCKFLSLIH